MLDLEKERDFLRDIEDKIKQLEIQKATNEERLKRVNEDIVEIDKKLASIGVSRDDIDETIEKLENVVLSLKGSIEKELSLIDESF